MTDADGRYGHTYLPKKYAKIQVPYMSGNLMHYVASYYIDVDWRNNEPFVDELELVGMRSGRSAKYVIWKSLFNGAQYPMFITDLLDLLTRDQVKHGRTERCVWVVQKRGQYYGLRLL